MFNDLCSIIRYCSVRGARAQCKSKSGKAAPLSDAEMQRKITFTLKRCRKLSRNHTASMFVYRYYITTCYGLS